MGCDAAMPGIIPSCRNFNPRIPYGMRHVLHHVVGGGIGISIHASRMGCDFFYLQTARIAAQFQSTHPVWDATVALVIAVAQARISIHASRMGCDDRRNTMSLTTDDFNPRIPYGMRPASWTSSSTRSYFNPRIPYGMRHRTRRHRRQWKYFNPRIPYGMRRVIRVNCLILILFQSTHPVWDATGLGCVIRRWIVDFNPRIPYGMRPDGNVVGAQRCISIHASRMGCDPASCDGWSSRSISIHASRMGCDSYAMIQHHPSSHFNPRIPYGMRLNGAVDRSSAANFNPRIPYGMRPVCASMWRASARFQSTHPVWDATFHCLLASAAWLFQSTHPVWDATRALPLSYRSDIFQSTHPVWDATGVAAMLKFATVISIHASRMGCDADALPIEFDFDPFQSTHPVWDATFTHSPASGDHNYFNPRIPYGMRPVGRTLIFQALLFQSTHPVWDATRPSCLHDSSQQFQSTHPVWDATQLMEVIKMTLRDFNPRIPYGMRLPDIHTVHAPLPFQSTHPVWDATAVTTPVNHVIKISIHASRMGCDHAL